MQLRVLTALLLLSTTGCATIHRHPAMTAFVVTTAVASTVVLTTMRDPSCHEYPAGKNGVGFPCPKDH